MGIVKLLEDHEKILFGDDLLYAHYQKFCDLKQLPPLYYAVYEEFIRRSRSFFEIEELHKLYRNLLDSTDENIKSHINSYILEIIISDYIMQKEIDEKIGDLQEVGYYALKSNKNAELFKLAIQLIKSDITLTSANLLSENRLYKNIANRFEDDNANGTSQMNLLQILLIAGIRHISGILTLNELNALFIDNKIYNPLESPMIQGVSIPDSLEDFDIFENYFYFNQKQQELYTPTLGYSFGGSREDTKYQVKNLKTEDCSSSVAKWVKSPITFTTYTMHMAYEGDCQNDKLCNNIKEILQSKNISEIIKGDIFVKGGHTGIISNITNETCFETISYNREIPDIEGLLYKEECCDENSICAFFTPKSLSEELEFSECSQYIHSHISFEE